MTIGSCSRCSLIELMLAIYAKNERVDLSPDNKKALKRRVENWK